MLDLQNGLDEELKGSTNRDHFKKMYRREILRTYTRGGVKLRDWFIYIFTVTPEGVLVVTSRVVNQCRTSVTYWGRNIYA